MNSIKFRVLLSYLLLIGVFITLLVITVFLNNRLVSKYEQINNNIIQEQALKDKASGLTDDAYNGFKTNDYSNYDKRLTDILEIEAILDVRFANDMASQVAYRGAKNSLAAVVNDITEVRKQLDQTGDLGSISQFYQDNTAKFEYVKQNIADLILVETGNLARVTVEMQRTKLILTIIMITIVIIGIVGSIIYAVVISRKITEPIISLSETARNIAEGDLQLNVREDLLTMQDETGSLSNSFHLMLQNLRRKIDELNNTKQEVEQRNEELQRFNKLMVDRELKMIELKKIISELQAKLEGLMPIPPPTT